MISLIRSEGSSTENFTATAYSSVLTLKGWKGHLLTVTFKAGPETCNGLFSKEEIDGQSLKGIGNLEDTQARYKQEESHLEVSLLLVIKN